MGFDSLVRDLVGIAGGLVSSLEKPVYHYRWVSTDARGKRSYADGDPVKLNALVEVEPAARYTGSGVIIPLKAKLLILQPIAPQGAEGRTEPIDIRDRFSLTELGTPWEIVGDPGLLDPTTERPYFAEVALGEPTQGAGRR